MEIVKLKTTSLETNNGQVEGLPVNPRQWTQSDIDSLARSLKETPELFEARPIIVFPYGDKFVILGGNLRFEASKQNKAKEVPCVVIPAGTPVDKLKEIVIKDNGSFGSWDFDTLANEWDDLPLADFGVPAWSAPKFEPNLNPQDGAGVVTDEDIEKAGIHLQEEVTPTEKTTIEVVCPHCGKTFNLRV